VLLVLPVLPVLLRLAGFFLETPANLAPFAPPYDPFLDCLKLVEEDRFVAGGPIVVADRLDAAAVDRFCS